MRFHAWKIKLRPRAVFHAERIEKNSLLKAILAKIQRYRSPWGARVCLDYETWGLGRGQARKVDLVHRERELREVHRLCFHMNFTSSSEIGLKLDPGLNHVWFSVTVSKLGLVPGRFWVCNNQTVQFELVRPDEVGCKLEKVRGMGWGGRFGVIWVGCQILTSVLLRC